MRKINRRTAALIILLWVVALAALLWAIETAYANVEPVGVQPVEPAVHAQALALVKEQLADRIATTTGHVCADEEIHGEYVTNLDAVVSDYESRRLQTDITMNLDGLQNGPAGTCGYMIDTEARQNQMRLYIVVSHEIGHAKGLGHT